MSWLDGPQPTEGDRVRDPETGMHGTVTRAWGVIGPNGEWWVEIQWDPSAMEATELERVVDE